MSCPPPMAPVIDTAAVCMLHPQQRQQLHQCLFLHVDAANLLLPKAQDAQLPGMAGTGSQLRFQRQPISMWQGHHDTTDNTKMGLLLQRAGSHATCSC